METKGRVFSRYQVFVIAILALLQFTVVLDFMVLSPLGEILLEKLQITTRQFGLVVSAYAFSAGISGILAAGFADKFDRKKMLLVFYTGFIIGTFLCALAPTYGFLLAARVITGLFGGVISAIGMAIIADLFRPEVRGRVMGFVQMAFALSQIIGVPLGWELAIRLNWHAPFWMIGAFGALMGIIIAIYMKPVNAHLQHKVEKNALNHLKHTLRNKHYSLAFATTILLSTGGFMLMPFGSTFSIHNMGIHREDLKIVYVATGLATFLGAPLLGRLSDKLGKMKVFQAATLLTGIMVVIFTNLGITPLYLAVVINALMMIGVFGRIIPAQAIMTSLPSMQDRGAFMSINSSVQQVSGGIASIVAGLIVYQAASGELLHYDILGYVILGAFAFTSVMMYYLNKQVQKQAATPTTPEEIAIAS
jgi:predicted MFS family arabinose efflux permease